MSFYKTKTLLIMSVTALLAGAPVLASAAAKANWSGNVTHVEDGDSIKVRPVKGGQPVNIRIDGIDAPEICQPGGKLSRDRLQQRLLGKRVEVQAKDVRSRVKNVQAKSVQGPQVARVFRGQQDQGKWMVSQGLAWSYRYRYTASPYAAQERQAKAAKLGLFSRKNAKPPIYPREFRKQRGSC